MQSALKCSFYIKAEEVSCFPYRVSKLSSIAQLALCVFGEKVSKSFVNYSRNLKVLQRTCPRTLCPWLRASTQQHTLKESKV